MKRRSGSILIMVIWILLLLTLLATSVSLRSRLGIKLSSFFTHRLENTYRMHSAVNLAAYFINKDDDPDNDSAIDSWYNTPQEFETFALSKEVSISIKDEESKINLNRVDKNNADAPVLTAFFDILKQNNVRLKASASDLITSIMVWRGDNTTYRQGKSILENEYKKGKAFESIDEFRLIKFMTPEDFEALKPYFTVYEAGFTASVNPVYFSSGSFPFDTNRSTFRVNINTVHELVLKAIVQSLRIGTNSEKELLYQTIAKARQGDEKNPAVIFDTMDLTPPGREFVRKLWPREVQQLEEEGRSPDLIPVPGIAAMINYLITQFFTVNSQFFSVRVETKKGGVLSLGVVETVLGPRQQILTKGAQRNYYPQWLLTDSLRGYPYQILEWNEWVTR